MDKNELRDTAWLAKRLGISITTIERLRSKNDGSIPQHIFIGNSIRYDENSVEQWISNQTVLTNNKGELL